MKVLLVAHHVPPRHVAGTEVYTFRLADALAKRRHEVTVFATDDDPLLEPGTIRRRRVGEFDVVELAAPRLATRPEESWQSSTAESTFDALLADLVPDVVHFQHLRFLSMGLPAVAKRRGIPTLMTAHDYWLLCARDGQLFDRESRRCDGPGLEKCAACLSDFRFGLSALEVRAERFVAGLRQRAGIDLSNVSRRVGLAARRFASKSSRRKSLPLPGAAGMLEVVASRRAAAEAVQSRIDVFISPSKHLRGAFEDAGFACGRWVVVGNGADPPPRTATRPRGAEPLRIGFAGTVTPLKGVDVLIEAVQQLPPDSYRLEIHGRDDLRPEFADPLKRAARGLPIRFHGTYAPEDAASFIPTWDVAVVPSRWVENQPLAILEAFAARVPVVASAIGGMRELVEDGRNGRLFEPEDGRALAAVLRGLCADRDQIDRLRSGIVAPPTMAEHAARIESLYEEALRRR